MAEVKPVECWCGVAPDGWIIPPYVGLTRGAVITAIEAFWRPVPWRTLRRRGWRIQRVLITPIPPAQQGSE